MVFHVGEHRILFFTFDNTNNVNIIYSKYSGIIGKINDKVEFKKLSDQCMSGLQFQRGFVSFPHHEMREKSMDQMSIVAWIKIDTLEHENTIYGCVGDDVMHHLEVKRVDSSSVGAIRWVYRPTRSNTVFAEVTDDIVQVGKFIIHSYHFVTFVCLYTICWYCWVSIS